MHLALQIGRFFITNGGDDASRRSLPSVQHALVAAGMRLFVLELSPPRGIFGADADVYGLNDLAQQIADPLGPSLTAMYQRMGAFYQLGIETPVSLQQPRNWKLEVVDSRFDKKQNKLFYQSDRPA